MYFSYFSPNDRGGRTSMHINFTVSTVYLDYVSASFMKLNWNPMRTQRHSTMRNPLTFMEFHQGKVYSHFTLFWRENRISLSTFHKPQSLNIPNVNMKDAPAPWSHGLRDEALVRFPVGEKFSVSLWRENQIPLSASHKPQSLNIPNVIRTDAPAPWSHGLRDAAVVRSRWERNSRSVYGIGVKLTL